MEEGAWSVWDLHCDQLAGSRQKTAPMAGHPCYPAMRSTPHRVVQAIVTYTLFTMEDKGIGWEGCKEAKGCTPQKKVATHQHTEMCFEALTNNARNMH